MENYLQRGIKSKGEKLIWVILCTDLRRIAYKLILNEQRRNLWTYIGRLLVATKVGKLWKSPSKAVVRVAAVLFRWTFLHSWEGPRAKPTQWLQQSHVPIFSKLKISLRKYYHVSLKIEILGYLDYTVHCQRTAAARVPSLIDPWGKHFLLLGWILTVAIQGLATQR